jgi:EpsG family
MGLIYIFSYLNLILFYFVNSQSKSKRLWRIFVGILPAILTASLRGRVGTDSASYLQFYSQIDNINISNVALSEFEPAFIAIVKCISTISSDPIFIQAVVSFLCGLMLLLGFIRIEKEGFFFIFLFFPNFYFAMTMTTIRYGLAFAVFICISSFLNEMKIGKAFLLLPPFFHITSIFVVLLNYLEKINIRNLIIISPTILLPYLFIFSHAEGKFTSYSDYSSPSEISGFAPMIITILASVILITACKANNEFNLNIVKMLVIQLIFFGLSKFSYAGLRLQWLLLSFLSYYLAKSAASGKLELSKIAFNCFVMLGLLSFAIQYRYFVLDISETPYIPYHFFWE